MRNKKVYAGWAIALLLVLLMATIVLAQGPISMDLFFRAVGFRGPVYIFSQPLYLDGTSRIEQDVGVENVGGISSVITASVDSTMTSTTALVTISDGEIWYVDRAVLQVTTNFDCTGDNCTVDVGDGSDADGLLNLADADLQAAATDYTGAPAGWQGLDGSAPAGVYLVGGPHIYAPSGADETIDVAVGGTDPAAGDAVLYVFYRRLE